MRTPWFWLWTTPVTIAVSLAECVAGLLAPDGAITHGLLRAWGRCLAWAAGVRLRVQPQPALPDGPCVVVFNHASMLDIPVSLLVVPLRIRFVSRPFFFKIPFMGWGMRLTGQVALDPKEPRQAARVLRDLGRHFERKRSLLLFPEGTRSADGSLGTYRRGPFLTAIQHGVPVLPVCMWGLHRIMPRGRLRVKGGEVHAVVGGPIATEGLQPSEARRLASEVEAWTRARLAEFEGTGSTPRDG